MSTMADQTGTLVGSQRRGERRLLLHAGVALAANLLLIVIWALAGGGYFWPAWTLLAFGIPVVLHGTVLLAVRARRTDVRRLLVKVAVAGSIELGLVAIWALAGGGYFWPVWPLLGMGFPLVVRALFVRFSGRGNQALLAARVGELTRTRAGAADVQAAELQRIERDLHDGAQARLVALAINLGLAEAKLEREPEAARELVLSARSEARQALTELRDLARGIYPPVLQDRGLEAAVRALVGQSPIRVEAQVDLDARLPAPIEASSYFVIAESLANAAKHAHATEVSIMVTARDGLLALTVGDDGVGGADSEGPGLSGLRKRVEALDGSFAVESPLGGPTVVHAEIPCES